MKNVYFFILGLLFIVNVIFSASILVFASNQENRLNEIKDSINKSPEKDFSRTAKQDPNTYPVCQQAMSNADMRECFGEEYKKVDKQLATKIDQLIADSSTMETQKDLLINLKGSQAAWMEYRDQSCLFMYQAAEGGSGGPTFRAICLYDITSSRLEELSNKTLPETTSISKVCERASAIANVAMRECFEQIQEPVNKLMQIKVTFITSDPSFTEERKQSFTKAQKAWEEYRDNNCKYVYEQANHGTGARVSQTQCLQEMTTKRLNQLDNYK